MERFTRCRKHVESALIHPSFEPSSLQDIGYKFFKQALPLAGMKSTATIYKAHQEVPVVWKYLLDLPVSIRERVYKDVDDVYIFNESGAYPTDLFLQEVLISKGFHHVELNHPYQGFSSEHVNTLLELLSVEGSQITCLVLKFPSSIEMNIDQRIRFRNVLGTANNLTNLRLGSYCDNQALKAIGEMCTNLEILAFSDFRVDDIGINFLVQNVSEQAEPHQIPDWVSAVWHLPEIFLPMAKLIGNSQNVLNYVRAPSPLCQTLTNLSISWNRGSITYKALLSILELVPGLKVLNYPSLHDVVTFRTPFFNHPPLMPPNFQHYYKRLYREVRSLPNDYNWPALNIESVYIISLDAETLAGLSSVCHNLRELVVERINTSPTLGSLSAFNCLSQLQSLFLLSNCDLVCDNLHALSSPIKSNLRELRLGNPNLQSFNLASLISCTNIQRVQLHFPMFVWNPLESDRWGRVESLRDLNLVGCIRGDDFLHLLKITPNLQIFYLNKIVEKPINFLERLCSTTNCNNTLQNLQVNHDYIFYEEHELISFLAVFRGIRHIGKLFFYSQLH